MVLIFLQLGEYSRKEDYLQHMKELINIKLSANDTHNILFEKLREKYKDDAVRREAVEEWVQFNEAQQEDKAVFDSVLCTEESYATFCLREK